jgi:hypothetical protein
MWAKTLKKYCKAAKLFFQNPKEFKSRFSRELSRPSILPLKLIRKLRFLFLPDRIDTNQNRMLLIYDLKVNPITFDFLIVLFYAEKLRINYKKQYLDVVFVNDDGLDKYLGADYIKSVGEESIPWRVTNLLIPLTRLFKSVSRISVVCEMSAFEIINRYETIHPKGYSRSEPKQATVHLQEPEFKYFNALHIPPNAHKLILKYFPPTDERLIVTITIRSYDYLPCRNSNIQAWINFARELNPAEYRVVIIPDASPAGIDHISLFKGFEVFDSACWNLELRAALYHRAFVNMGIEGGPLQISTMLADAITILIDPILDTPKDYLADILAAGNIPGKKLNYYSKSTMVVLGRDNKNTITDAFWNAIEKHGNKNP